jgi:putative ABC transport system permease protein
VQEIIILALIGSVVGTVLGLMLAVIISAIGIPMPPMPNTNTGYTGLIRIIPWEVGKAIAVGFCGTLGAVLMPARRAARLHVVDALRCN